MAEQNDMREREFESIMAAIGGVPAREYEAVDDPGGSDEYSIDDMLDDDKVGGFQDIAEAIYDHLKAPGMSMANEYREGAGLQRVERLEQPVTRREKAEWLAEHYGWYNSGTHAKLFDWFRFRNLRGDIADKWMRGLDIYDNADTLSSSPDTIHETIGRAAVGAALDPVWALLGFVRTPYLAVKPIAKWVEKKQFGDMVSRLWNSSVPAPVKTAINASARAMHSTPAKTAGGITGEAGVEIGAQYGLQQDLQAQRKEHNQMMYGANPNEE